MSGIDSPPSLDNIVIVVSHPTEPRNIGAVARALKTMGLRHLRLIQPRDPYGDDARAVAHGAEDILEAAEVHLDAAGALADVRIAAGTSCRPRHLRKHAFLPPRELCARLVEHTCEGKVALLFGTERTGLTNEEIDRCRYLSAIEMAQPQPSLNLAQAVMVYAWELRQALMARDATALPARHRPVEHPHRGTRLPTQFDLDMMYAHLDGAMVALDYSEYERRKFLTYLRHLHQRAGIVDWELQIYHLMAAKILMALGRSPFTGGDR